MKRRGFAFIEMLYVLAIMPIFMLIATQLYWAVMKTADATQRELSARATFDAASNQIWRDLFAASELRQENAGRILILTRSGAHIYWENGTKGVVRIAADRREFALPYNLHLHIGAQGSDVTLQLTGPQGSLEQVTCAAPQSFWRPS